MGARAVPARRGRLAGQGGAWRARPRGFAAHGARARRLASAVKLAKIYFGEIYSGEIYFGE